MRGLSPVAASGDRSSSRCAGLSLSRPLLLWSTGSRRAGSAVVAHGPGRSAARGIFPDQGSNPCPLHWQADSQPLRHQGSPSTSFLIHLCCSLLLQNVIEIWLYLTSLNDSRLFFAFMVSFQVLEILAMLLERLSCPRSYCATYLFIFSLYHFLWRECNFVVWTLKSYIHKGQSSSLYMDICGAP